VGPFTLRGALSFGGDFKKATVVVQSLDDKWGGVDYLTFDVKSSPDWTTFTAPVKLTDKARHVIVHLMVEGKGTVWMDDIQLFDGDVPEASKPVANPDAANPPPVVTTGPQINRAADARKPDQLIVNLNRADVRPWKQVFVGGSGTMRTIKVHPLDGTVVGGSDVSGPFYYDAKIAVPKDATVPTYGMPDQPWTMRPVGWRATLDHFGRDNEGLIHTDQLAFDPTNADKLFYVGGQEWRPGRGVLVTHDRGKSWWFSPLLRPDGKAVFITNASSSERLKVNPQNPQTVYYGSRRDGLYRSVNGGAN
jgi:hypothetical protein